MISIREYRRKNRTEKNTILKFNTLFLKANTCFLLACPGKIWFLVYMRNVRQAGTCSRSPMLLSSIFHMLILQIPQDALCLLVCAISPIRRKNLWHKPATKRHGVPVWPTDRTKPRPQRRGAIDLKPGFEF